jgi:7,8-dihydropterin-6-yl-methyl-4-(beta-D-ribofuranosyl)aminobenzene 5'-phosphate synthase
MRWKLLACLVLLSGTVSAAPRGRVKSLKVTVLSTMLADFDGIGEWGFAALVEADGARILFDTGARPTTVLENARELKVDLSTVTDVVLSHNHGDHTGGLVTLRRELAKQNPRALSRAHVGEGIFWSRPSPEGERNKMIATRGDYEAAAGPSSSRPRRSRFAPGVWLTGRVPRVHPEKNYPKARASPPPAARSTTRSPRTCRWSSDTDEGLVVLTGCGHAGVVNTVEHARKTVRAAPLHAVLGGFHLFPLDDAALAWTAEKLAGFGVVWLLGAHCTGIEPVYRIRQLAKLDRAHAVVGSVGSSFTLGKGIDPLNVAR